MSVVLSKSLKTELYRKAVHLSSLWMSLFILWADRNVSIVTFSLLLALNLIVEHAAYRKTAVVGDLFRRMFIRTLRNREVCRERFVPSGSVYILAASLIVSVCFTSRAAAAAMGVVLVADTCAALVGKVWGTYRFSNGKSIEGTAAFFSSAVWVIVLFFPTVSPLIVFSAALLAAAAEFFEKETGIDDNFAVPLVSGFVLNLISL